MTTPITSNALLQRLAEDIAARKRGPASLKQHVRAYKRFAAWLGRSPETATAEDVRNFQHHLADQSMSVSTRNATMTTRAMRRWATSSRSTSSTLASTPGRGLALKLTLETAKELRAALDRAIAAAEFEEAEVRGKGAVPTSALQQFRQLLGDQLIASGRGRDARP